MTLTARQSNLITWGLVGIGVAAIGTGVAFSLKRRREQLGRPRLVEKPVKRNGMTVSHYRGKMPIEDRVYLLQDLVMKGVKDPEMRKLALQVTRHCPERDDHCEARAIYDFVRQNVRYTGDVAPIALWPNGPVEGIDFYQTGRRTLEFGGGDCDDQDVLVATLLALNGIPPRFRVTATSKFADWSHIYPLAGLPKMKPKKWIPLDTTLPGTNNFGKEVPYAKARDFAA